MIHKVFSIYDSKIDAFMQPFFSQSKGAAVRALTDLLADKTHPIAKHPEDYTLFELSDWDDTTAFFTAHATPISIGLALEFIPVDPPF